MNFLRTAVFAAAAVLPIAPPAPALTAAHRHHTTPVVRAPAPAESQGFTAERLARLTSAMHAAVDQKQVAGIVTLLARHGRVVAVDSYGKQSLASGSPMPRDAIFRIYSQTKPVMGVAMAILFEEGKWRLDDPVTKFIPEFANLKVFTGLDKDGKPITEDMKRPPTMRELLTHTAGFGYGLRDDNYVDQQFRAQRVLSSNGLSEMIGKIATIPLKSQPGTHWSYSASVDIQGYIIEKLTGQSLADFLAQRIFKPLGMVDTGFVVPAEKASRLAAVYGLNPANGALVEVTPAMSPLVQDFTKVPPMYSGGGGLVSTAADYARFCQMILNRGELNGVRILAPATVALLGSDLLESSVVADPGEPDPIGGEGLGFGFDLAVMKNAAKLGSLAGEGSIFWGGAAGTWFWIDRKNDLFFLGMIQLFSGEQAGNRALIPVSQTMVYSALTNPEK